MMKSVIWKLGLAAVFLWVTAFARSAVAVAADDTAAGTGEQFQQLERRVNQLAERQEQILRRLGTPEAGQEQPMPRWQTLRDRPMPALAGPGLPAPAKAKRHDGLGWLLGLILLTASFCNILLAVWIFTDIRKRGEGSGLFIALALVAGIPAAIIYALVRIGDKKAQTEREMAAKAVA